MWIEYISPLVKTLKNYKKKDFINDFFASITLLAIVLPQSIAYASLSGISPVYGLYTSTVPVIFFSLFASSRHTVTGTFALCSILLKSSVDTVLESVDVNRYQLTMAVSLIAGLFQILLAKFGNLLSKNLLPDCLLSGMSASAGFQIAKSQIGPFFGFFVPSFKNLAVFKSLFYLLSHLLDIHVPTLICGFGVVSICFVLHRVFPKLPEILISVSIATLSTYIYNSNDISVEYGKIKIIDSIPSGLPSFFGLPTFPDGKLSSVLLYSLYPSFKLALITALMTMAISLFYAKKQNYVSEISTNREIAALGLSSIIGVILVGSYSSCGSLSRTAILVEAKAVSQVANILTALFVLLSLLFLTSTLSKIPLAALAAVVLLAVSSLMKQIKDGVFLLKQAVTNGLKNSVFIVQSSVWWVTFLIVLFVDLDIGMASGMGLCLLIIIIDLLFPHFIEVVEYKTDNGHQFYGPQRLTYFTTAKMVKDFKQSVIYFSCAYSEISNGLIVSHQRRKGVLIHRLCVLPFLASVNLVKMMINLSMSYWTRQSVTSIIIDVSQYPKLNTSKLVALSAGITSLNISFVVNPVSSVLIDSINDYLLADPESIIFKSLDEALEVYEKINSPCE